MAISDTAICYGEQITLKSNQVFKTFNWNNSQSTGSTYTVNRPGLYSVNVRTLLGCEGADTVLVKDKGCVQAVYLPTAFTPNSDGINDVFRASVLGIIDFFELRVYNRWGELVFRTKDSMHGWNGIHKQKQQISDHYVWYVRYRFVGSASIQDQKGTILLIR
jgi:gliding motility-associated-like protein